jgi:DNA-directed RNA polymerase subunit alpha
MQIDLTINKGRGYVPAEENREFCTDVNVIPIDSIYTPIRNVKYSVEPFVLSKRPTMINSLLKLQRMVPFIRKMHLKRLQKFLIYHFMLFSDEKITLETF